MGDVNEVVAFTSMAEGTREDYELLERLEAKFAAGTPDRVLEMLRGLAGALAGYQVDRPEHSLQCATRAHRDGADEEMVVVALLHDIGDLLSPFNHSELAAAVLRPYVSECTYWIVRHHGLFQSYYYAHHTGGDRHARDAYRTIPGTRIRWSSAIAGTSRPSTPAMNHYRLSSSSRWCGASSSGRRSARAIAAAASITTTGYQNGPRFWSLTNASDAHIKMALPPPMRSRKHRRLKPSL